MADTEDDYGMIRPSLIKQLRSILDLYPDDGQILKELIQNAEDAGASVVKFVYDENTFSCQTLHHEGMAKFQGPALYAYNDGEFRHEDWKGIRMLQDSVKVKDPLKVGRFGLGFKSVLHMTDLPSVLSCDRLFMIDPHEEYFRFQDNRTSGYAWRLVERREAMRQIPDQFKPYVGMLDCTQETFDSGYYNGTLFRFPFRTEASDLSDTVYDSQRIMSLFENFKADAPTLLLFLKNLEKIELYKRSAGQKELTLVFEVKVAEECLKSIRLKRQEFRRCCMAQLAPSGVSHTYILHIETVDYVSGVRRKCPHKWLIAEHRAGRDVSGMLTKLSQDKTLALLPLVGVALQMNCVTETEQSAGSKPPDGQVFCFLPLPVEQQTATGLPVHVNGYFAISQDRRHLKWPTPGFAAGQDKSVQWNQCLLKELIPKVYAELLSKAVQICQDSTLMTAHDIYNAIPNKQAVYKQWQVVLGPLFKNLAGMSLVQTVAGRWCVPDRVLFDCLINEEEQTRAVLARILQRCKVEVARVPAHVYDGFQEIYATLHCITPATARGMIQSRPESYGQLNCGEKLQLLKYLLTDGQHLAMEGIHLLPCADGTWKPFGTLVYMTNKQHPVKLFPGQEAQLLDPNLDWTTKSHMQALATATGWLQNIDNTMALKLIKQVLPVSWTGYAVVDSSLCSIPIPNTWFEILWNYMRITHPYDLSMLEGLHIMPSSHEVTQLLPLCKTCPVLLYSDGWGESLSSNMCKILGLFGVHVLNSVPRYVTSHSCVSGTYIKYPRPQDIVEVLYQSFQNTKQGKQAIGQFNNTTTWEDKYVFLQAVTMLQNCSEGKKNFLRTMGLFPTFQMLHGSQVFTSISKVKEGANLGDFPCHINSPLINLSDKVVSAAAAVLGIRALSRKEVLNKFLLSDMICGRITGVEVEKMMNHIFRHFGEYSTGDNFLEMLSQVPFVECGLPQKKRPSEVCDPFDKTLQRLYAGERGMFPAGASANAEMLIYLRQIGMKTSTNLGANDLVDVMKTIKRSMSGNISRKCCTLLHILNDQPQILQENVGGMSFREYAKSMPWIPVCVNRPADFPSSAPWKAGKVICKPSEVRPYDDMFLCGCVGPVISEKVGDEMKEAFKWNDPPSLEVVIGQLELVVRSYQPAEKARYLSVINHIYARLQTSDAQTLRRLRDRRQLQKWVWHGDGFTSVEFVFEESTVIDLRPHVHVLPDDLMQFRDLFVGQGMAQACTPETLVSVLHQLNTSEQEHAPDQRQSSRNLQQTIDVLNYLKDHVASFSEYLKKDILVPIAMTNKGSSFRMMPVCECTFHDKASMRQNINLPITQQIHFVHDDVPWTTAEKLGVTPLIRRVLHTEDFGFEAYGQTESLTSRLKNLLQDYSDGLAIFKEMIQNADDAGATEVRFLFDERENMETANRLLDDGMEPCQGSALWVYNDGTFSDQDFDNIIQLGAATKESDETKIGKFGLGFNSVYNITDVPSFISRRTIAIFDPHRTHLGKCLKDCQPGIRLDITKNKPTIQTYPDQFSPYHNIYGCNLMSDEFEEYNGTLFRLPLRTKQQAVTSKISQLNYDRCEMFRLLSLLIQHAGTLLLFTQHVRTVRVHHIPRDGSPEKMNEIFTLEKRLVQNVSQNHCSNISMSSLLTKASFFTRNSSGSDSPQWTFMVQVKHQTHGNSLEFQAKEPVTENWLITESCGCRTSLELAKEAEHLVPVGGAAIKLTSTAHEHVPSPLLNENTSSDDQAMAFCFLPMPIATNLPIHINGTFAVDFSRQHLSTRVSGDKCQERGEWNEALLEDAVNRAYQQCLYDLREVVSHSVDMDFYDLWPTFNVPGMLLHLVRAFYASESMLMKLPFCARDGKPLTLESVIFLDTGEMPSEIAANAVGMLEMCSELHVLQPPLAIIECLRHEKHDKILDEKIYDIHRFFSEIFFPKLDGIKDVSDRDDLLVYALQQNDKLLDQLLKQYDCIPSSSKGSLLCKVSTLIHPHCSAGKLFKPEDGRFPSGRKFVTPQILDLMTELGMWKDDLCWNDVLDRAKSVKDMMLIGENEGKTRLDCFLQFLDRKISPLYLEKTLCEQTEVDKNALKNVEFLRILQRHQLCVFQWYGDESSPKDLCKASEVFPSSSKHLVSVSKLIVDDTRMSNSVKRFLSLQEKIIPSELVIKQLEKVLRVDPQTLVDEEYGQLMETIEAIYDYLERHFSTNQTFPLTLEHIASTPCLLINRNFVLPTNVAFRFRGPSCSRYLQTVPEQYRIKYQHLLQALGVKERFEVADYVLVLRTIADKIRGAQLQENQMKICTSVITLLNEAMEKEKQDVRDVVRQHGIIYVPNKKMILEDASSLCYDDCPWVDRGDLQYTHKSISYEISCRLGINTTKDQVVKKNAKGIPFGQKEKLTTSIQRILKTYPRDHQILKELIQNADDAGATEIHFIRDGRTYGKTKLFNESWEPLQGPALCVYNNRSFTVTDLESIQNLGEGSKREDPCKTGQYGIGFSSVYHLTDVPSILTSTEDTGQTLCVFDPNCCYVPGATPGVPGMRYSLDHLAEFTDVTSCYHMDKFDLVNGTMFRLPLRTEDMADKSHLAAQGAVTMECMSDILEKLKKELFDILLFTNNLEEIKVSDIDQSTGKLQNTHSVWINKIDTIQGDRSAVLDYAKQCVNKLDKGEALQTLSRQEFSYILNIEDNARTRQKWYISQTIGFPDGVEIPTNIIEAFDRGDMVLLPRGGCAMRLDEVHPENKKAFCFLPLPDKTGLPLHVNGHFALGHENRGYVFDKVKASDYKQEWNDLLCSSLIADCYVDIMEYQRRLLESSLDNKSLDRYHKLFPSYNENYQDWHRLVKDIYKCIERRQAKVFPVLTMEEESRNKQKGKIQEVKWLSLGGKENIYFCRDEYILDKRYSVERVSDAAPSGFTELKATLSSLGMNLVSGPVALSRTLEQSEVKTCIVTPESVIEFIRAIDTEAPQCNIAHSLPCPLRKTAFKNEKMFYHFLRFCAKADNFAEHLAGLPLLLTADDTLRIFSDDNPIFTPRYCKGLLLKSTDKFVSERFFYLFQNNHDQTCVFLVDPTIEDIAKLLPVELPGECCAGEIVIFDKKNPVVRETQLKAFWQFIASFTMPGKPSRRTESTDDGSKILSSNVVEPTSATSGKLGNGVSKTDSVTVTKESCNSLKADNKRNPHAEGNVPDELVHLTQVLCLFEKFSLIPCRHLDENYLFPFSRARDIICGISVMHSVLNKIGIPELIPKMLTYSMDLFASQETTLAKSIVTSSDNPTDMLILMHRYFTNARQKEQTEDSTKHGIMELSIIDAELILSYFTTNLSAIETAGKVELLKGLPIHITVSGHIITLTDICIGYFVPANIPQFASNDVQTKDGIALISDATKFKKLYALFGYNPMSVIDMYCKYILQHLESFSEHDTLIHMCFLHKNHLQQLDDETKILITSLHDTFRLKGGDGISKRASEFCDPSCELFLEMFPDDNFPPMFRYVDGKYSMTRWANDQWFQFMTSDEVPTEELWSNKDWLEFLRIIGLVQHPSPSHLTDFAWQIEREASKCDIKVTTRKAKKLVIELYKVSTADMREACVDIRNIPFIPQEEVSAELHKLTSQCGKRHGNKISLIPFQGSIACAHEMLIWTCMVLLPEWALPQYHGIYGRNVDDWMDRLRISTEPSVKQVMTHVSNIVPSVQKVDDCTDTIDRIFKCLYTFLGKHDLCAADIQNLSDQPLIMVRGIRALVKPYQTVVNLPPVSEIRPYLYKVPNCLGEFVPLFEKLGVTETPTGHHYARVLADIEAECGERRPLPDNMRAIFRAVRALFHVTVDLDQLVEMYLPNEQGFLKRSSLLVFNDAPAFRQRLGEAAANIPLMAAFREAGIGSSAAHDFMLLLPKELRPRLLSDVVQEKLSETEVLDSGQCHFATEIQERLRSETFMNAVKRLVLHESWKAGDNLSDQDVTSLVGRLFNIEIVGRENLKTHLVLDETVLPESEKDQLCFHNRSKKEASNWTVYVCNAASKKSQMFNLLGISLDIILDRRMRSCVAYLPSLITCSLEETDEILSAYNISEVHHRSVDPATHISLSPHIGGPVPNSYRANLITNGRLEEGMLVAYEFRNEFIFVTVVKINKDGVLIRHSSGEFSVDRSLLRTFHY